MIFSPSHQKVSCTISASDIEVLENSREFKQRLLSLISVAKRRIYITALYLQDDEAGNEIISALLEAKKANPDLLIRIFVDYHRAQRGLIGEGDSLGNRSKYLEVAKQHPNAIEFYGVPVKTRELFGVLHLKGMVFDDTVLYSGASINNVYCHQGDKYRLDRYHIVHSKSLADSFIEFNDSVFVSPKMAVRLDQDKLPSAKQIKLLVKSIKRLAKGNSYRVKVSANAVGDIKIKPFLGFGKRGNLLNQRIQMLLKQSQQKLVIFTPYFNLPKSLVVELRKALRRGVDVVLVVGDKTANDFFIPEDKPFTPIGIIPYAYEQMLRGFVKQQQKYLAKGQLKVHLWRDGDNSYHLKGIVSDDSVHLLTGNNLNPRAWGLDIENGLIIEDPNQHLTIQWQLELAAILNNTRQIRSIDELQSTSQYPDKVKRLWRRLHLSQIDRLLKRFL